MKKLFSHTKAPANVIAFSLVIASSVLLISSGVGALVMQSARGTSKTESANVSYFAAERGMEYALFDISGHLPGYEIDENSDYAKVSTPAHEGTSTTTLSLESRVIQDAGNITIPPFGKGTSSRDTDWNTLQISHPVFLPLYTENSTEANTYTLATEESWKEKYLWKKRTAYAACTTEDGTSVPNDTVYTTTSSNTDPGTPQDLFYRTEFDSGINEFVCTSILDPLSTLTCLPDDTWNSTGVSPTTDLFFEDILLCQDLGDPCQIDSTDGDSGLFRSINIERGASQRFFLSDKIERNKCDDINTTGSYVIDISCTANGEFQFATHIATDITTLESVLSSNLTHFTGSLYDFPGDSCPEQCILGTEVVNHGDNSTFYASYDAQTGTCDTGSRTCEYGDFAASTQYPFEECQNNEDVEASLITSVNSAISSLESSRNADSPPFSRTPFERLNVSNHPFLQNKNLREYPLSAWDAGSIGSFDQKVFQSIFLQNLLVDPDIQILIRVSKIELESFIDPSLVAEDTIVIRWKIIGKDTNGNPISLVPHFDTGYTPGTSDYGCGSSMLCLDDFSESSHLFVSSTTDDLTLQIPDIKGKVVSTSTDPDIQAAVTSYNDTGDGVVDFLTFLRDTNFNITYPELFLFYETKVGEVTKHQKLEYKILLSSVPDDGLPLNHPNRSEKFSLPSGSFSIKSTGNFNSFAQEMTAEVQYEKEGIIPAFYYTVFTE